MASPPPYGHGTESTGKEHHGRIQAWREVDELPDRELMSDGHWSV